MPAKYILDSCAMLAFIYRENGDEVVKSILMQAQGGSVEVYMNKLNLFESYYDIMRSKSLQQAEDYYSMVKASPIKIIDSISDPVFRKAGLLKTQYRISLADSILLGEAFAMDASLLTSDHHEFDIVEKNENIRFLWIR